MSIPTKPYIRKPCNKTICVVDCETDPFAYGETINPFAIGFYDGSIYTDFWGNDCVAKYFDYLDKNYAKNDLLIYAHNGGNFDFYFFLNYMDAWTTPFIVDGRMVRIQLQGQEYRDSYKLLPFPLEAYKKTLIDYGKFHRDQRHHHRPEIAAYLRDDCIDLYALVYAYMDEFGDRLTIGSTSLPQLRSFHGFDPMDDKTDNTVRPFFYGGRVECFETGMVRGDMRLYDVNSMYPHVMHKYLHPVGASWSVTKRIGHYTHFAHIEATSKGALPVRDETTGSLSFPHTRGDFFATIHEINAGIETGTLEVHRVRSALDCIQSTTFADFVDHFYNNRLEAKARGDAIHALFYKYILNSAYGKFAQDPRDYQDYMITGGEIPPRENGDPWIISTVTNGIYIWQRPNAQRLGNFKNIATAASITGAARAELLRGIAASERPVYCDTDSILCGSLQTGENIDIDPHRLGAWKLEGMATQAAIAGKKLYAIFDGPQCIKKACKGGKLSANEIVSVAKGDQVEYANPVPKFSLKHEPQYMTRTFRATAT